MTSSSSGTRCAHLRGSRRAGSKKVAAQRDYRIHWRFISLRLLNKHKDYATEFPPEYEAGHTAGLRMLRVAAAVRADLGSEPHGALVRAYGESYWNQAKGSGMKARVSTPDHAADPLRAAGLSPDYANALDDTSRDALLDEETQLAMSRTGRDVGTPIITFQPPDGVSFFGPVPKRITRTYPTSIWANCRPAGCGRARRTGPKGPGYRMLASPWGQATSPWGGARRVWPSGRVISSCCRPVMCAVHPGVWMVRWWCQQSRTS